MDLCGGLGMRGLGPPQLANTTRRTDEARPLAKAAASEHLQGCVGQSYIYIHTVLLSSYK